MGGGGAAGADAAFGIPTQGPSGWRGLIENKKALGLATFASLGGVLYVSRSKRRFRAREALAAR
jgi:hypothetical protein